MAEPDAVAGFDTFRRPRKGLPPIRPDTHMQGRRDGGLVAIALADAFELGGDHLGVVEHQRIARLEEINEVADMLVLQG